MMKSVKYNLPILQNANDMGLIHYKSDQWEDKFSKYQLEKASLSLRSVQYILTETSNTRTHLDMLKNSLFPLGS